MLERLRTAARRTVGTKQTLRAVERGLATEVFVARDAEPHVVRQLLALCRQRGVTVHEVESMQLLGRTCGVEVGAASAAILGEERTGPAP
jgi:large subunit ribosomal protein L7A